MKNIIRTTIAILLATFAFNAEAAPKSKEGNKRYPLKTCIVTDNDLDSMGGEKRLVHEGREVKFCCSPCVKKFKANPAKYLRKI